MGDLWRAVIIMLTYTSEEEKQETRYIDSIPTMYRILERALPIGIRYL